jgi:hypothetical protein
MGDNAATELAAALGKNSCLQTLMWDENNLTLTAWQGLASALKSNKTLTKVPPPMSDMTKAVQGSKDRAKAREKVEEVLKQISDQLKENAKASISSE